MFFWISPAAPTVPAAVGLRGWDGRGWGEKRLDFGGKGGESSMLGAVAATDMAAQPRRRPAEAGGCGGRRRRAWEGWRGRT